MSQAQANTIAAVLEKEYESNPAFRAVIDAKAAAVGRQSAKQPPRATHARRSAIAGTAGGRLRAVTAEDPGTAGAPGRPAGAALSLAERSGTP